MDHEDDGLTSGNHVVTVVSYQIDGTASIQRFDAQQFPALSTSTIYGAGLADLDFNGQIDANDVALFGQVLQSDNQQFNAAADFNGDGQIDNSDFLLLYSTLQANHADAATLAAYQQLLGPPPGGYDRRRSEPDAGGEPAVGHNAEIERFMVVQRRRQFR